jgi:methionine-rich copper-binding protein CopC
MKRLRFYHLTTIFLLTFWGAAQAQFTVQNFSPAHGLTNVPLSTTIEVTFSAPLDAQNFNPADSDTYPFNIELQPDSAETQGANPVLSNNNMTVSIQAQLKADTRYTVLVIGARSATGQPLDKPVAFTFTTGNSLPTGSISGNITYTAGTPEGTVVAAFGGSLFGNDQLVCYSIADASGNYTIEFMPAGDFFTAAIKDTDLDSDINPATGDPIGGYDLDQNKLTDRITLANNEQKGSINIILQHPDPITANQLNPNLDAFAKTFAADAEVTAVFGINLQTDGKARVWFYVFSSPSANQRFGFTATTVACLPFIPNDDEDDGLPIDIFINPLPAGRIDSDTAMNIALENGGQDFLDDNENVEITVIGFNDDPFALFQGDDGEEGSRMRFKNSRGNRLRLLNEIKSASENVPVWVFIFNSKDGQSGLFGGFFAVGVHMETGAPIRLSPSKSLAAANTQAAKDTARALVADAKLVAVIAPAFGFSSQNLAPDGNALLWLLLFHSASLDTILQVSISNGLILGVDTMDVPLPSNMELPATFVNSDVAVAAAEAAGGAALRQGDPLILPEAVLAFGLYQQDPTRLVWSIRYGKIGIPEDQIETFSVDALTGMIISDIDDEIPGAPQDFVLQRVYPNPVTANQLLRIPFQLSRNAEVEISLYNLLGQQVRQISRGNMATGEHTVSIASLRENLAAGVYFVQMRVRERSGAVRIFSQRLLVK